MDGNLRRKLIEAAANLGFSQVGIKPAKPARRIRAYFNWLESGYYGEMAYMARPDRIVRRQDLNEILPDVRSIISVGLDYKTISLPERISDDPSRGRISSYAWGVDYHNLMIQKLDKLGAILAELAEKDVRSIAYVDTGAILERDHGESAGLGFTGKNTMLISPSAGSYFFIGQLLTTAQLRPTAMARPMPTCGSCLRCIDACPTAAFPEPYVLDARRCISYLTIELKGWIPREMRSLMGNWIFGCDICQDVCPFNRFSPDSEVQAFYPSHVDGAAPPLVDILSLSEAEFNHRYDGSPIKRIKRRGLIRNACVAAGNWGDSGAVPALVELLADHEPLIRGHAAWALGRIRVNKAVIALQGFIDAETDNGVRKELSMALLGV